MKHDHKPFIPAQGRAVRAAYGGDVADRVRRFTPMVRRLAWHLHAHRDGIELEDLMQVGLMALTEAARRHAGPGEDGFAAYAKMRARGAMVDLIRRHVPRSRGNGDRRRLLRGHETALRASLGRDPREDELAAAMGLSGTELASLRAQCEPLRFEALDEAYSDGDPAFADALPDALTMLQDQELRGHVTAAIGALPERLQLVVQLYFVEELNLAEIAGVLEVSIPRVHQLKAQALDRLRAALEGVAELI